MYNGYDFVYDGKSSISENVKMLYTEADPFEFTKSIPDKDVNLFTTSRSGRWNISGVSTPEPLSFQMQIMMYSDDIDLYANGNPLIKRNRISGITHWLFDNTQFKRLQILTEDMKDMYFMAIFKDVEYFEAGGDVCGFRATVLCDNIGAYEDKSLKRVCNGETKMSLQCLHDGIYEITPTYEITLNTGAVDIIVNDTIIKLKSLAAGSTVTIDTETLIAKSSENENLYVGDRFNLTFPTLHYGKNTIVVNGDCVLKVKYTLVREVGC